MAAGPPARQARARRRRPSTHSRAAAAAPSRCAARRRSSCAERPSWCSSRSQTGRGAPCRAAPCARCPPRPAAAPLRGADASIRGVQKVPTARGDGAARGASAVCVSRWPRRGLVQWGQPFRWAGSRRRDERQEMRRGQCVRDRCVSPKLTLPVAKRVVGAAGVNFLAPLRGLQRVQFDASLRLACTCVVGAAGVQFVASLRRLQACTGGWDER